MKKINKIFAVLAVFVGFAFMGCTEPKVTDKPVIDDPITPPTPKTEIYVDAEGYDMTCWQCWDGGDCRDTAVISEGEDGGIKLTVGNPKKCDGTYFGANLAAGANYGGTANIDGKSFDTIKFKIRGTMNVSTMTVYAIGAVTEKITGTGTIPTLTEEWQDVELTGFNFNEKLSSAFLLFADNGCGTGGVDWVEIKGIQWLKNGEAVVPAYVD